MVVLVNNVCRFSVTLKDFLNIQTTAVGSSDELTSMVYKCSECVACIVNFFFLYDLIKKTHSLYLRIFQFETYDQM